MIILTIDLLNLYLLTALVAKINKNFFVHKFICVLHSKTGIVKFYSVFAVSLSKILTYFGKIENVNCKNSKIPYIDDDHIKE